MIDTLLDQYRYPWHTRQTRAGDILSLYLSPLISSPPTFSLSLRCISFSISFPRTSLISLALWRSHITYHVQDVRRERSSILGSFVLPQLPKKDVFCLRDEEGSADAEQGREIDTATEMMEKLTREEGERGSYYPRRRLGEKLGSRNEKKLFKDHLTLKLFIFFKDTLSLIVHNLYVHIIKNNFIKLSLSILSWLGVSSAAQRSWVQSTRKLNGKILFSFIQVHAARFWLVFDLKTNFENPKNFKYINLSLDIFQQLINEHCKQIFFLWNVRNVVIICVVWQQS